MPLSEPERIQMLETIARDESLKATQRLRALEELGKIDARRGVQRTGDDVMDELAPDPMADMTEWEQARQRRSRRAS